MKFLTILLWVSLLLGQLGAITLGEGIILYAQDVVLVTLVMVASVRYNLLGMFRRSPLLRPIALFAAVGIVSLLVNVREYPLAVTAKGSLYLLRWIVYALVYAIVLSSPQSVRFWLWWLGSFGVALSAVGLLQFVLYPDLRNLWYLGWDPHYYRVFATLLDPNYVGLLLVLAVFVLWHLKKRLMVMIAALALMLTYSRSSYLALLAGVSAASFFRKFWKQWMFAMLAILLIITYIPKPGGETLSLDRYDSTVSRLQNWGQTIGRIGQKPVFGFGFNVVPFLAKDEADRLPGRRGAGIDSSLLFVGATTGLVGLGSYLWLLTLMMRSAFLAENASLRMLIVSSWAAILVHSLFVNSLFYPWVMVWMWILAGITNKR